MNNDDDKFDGSMFDCDFPHSDKPDKAKPEPTEFGSLEEFENLSSLSKENEAFFDSLNTDPGSGSSRDAFRQSDSEMNASADSGATQDDPLSVMLSGQQMSAEVESSEDSSISEYTLFVTPEGKLSPHLLFALRVEQIEALIANTCDDAIIKFSGRAISRALIHNSFVETCDGLISALKNNNKDVAVSFYASEAGLLTGDVTDYQTAELFENNLRLAAYLTDSQADTLLAHTTEVTELCQRLSDKYEFPTFLRLALLSAAQWHDIALRDLKSTDGYRQTDIVSLSVSRLKALDAPAIVVQLLQLMSQPSQSIEGLDEQTILAGCVLALADYYSHHWSASSTVKSGQRYEICRDIRQFAKHLAIPDVADALIEIIDTELRSEQPDSASFSVHLLDMTGAELSDNPATTIEQALQSAGFFSTVSHSIEDCARQWNSDTPQALIVLHAGNVQEVTDTLFALALNGITIANASTMLLVPENMLDKLVWSIKHGIEDVFPLSLNPDILLAKLLRAQKRIEDLSRVRIAALRDLGTHGSLEDMNLIKLLEALRDSAKPLRLNVTAEGWQLTVFVKDNCVLFATCNELTGIDAISQSLDWTRGVWSIDPVDERDLPNLNLGLSIDSVMLEACVKCDLSTRVTHKA